MNLKFIYFSKRERGGYWRGALVRRNTGNLFLQHIPDAITYSYKHLLLFKLSLVNTATILDHVPDC